MILISMCDLLMRLLVHNMFADSFSHLIFQYCSFILTLFHVFLWYIWPAILNFIVPHWIMAFPSFLPGLPCFHIPSWNGIYTIHNNIFLNLGLQWGVSEIILHPILMLYNLQIIWILSCTILSLLTEEWLLNLTLSCCYASGCLIRSFARHCYGWTSMDGEI